MSDDNINIPNSYSEYDKDDVNIIPPGPERDENLEEFNDEFKYANSDNNNEIVVDGIDIDGDGTIDDYDLWSEK